MIRKGESGLFFLKTADDLIMDVSGFFEELFSNQKDKTKGLRDQIEKWLSMDLSKIIQSDSYKNLPLAWRIELLDHLNVDYRFIADRSFLAQELLKLRKSYENHARSEIYKESFNLALKSKNDALNYLNDCISKTKNYVIHFKHNNSNSLNVEKEFWEARLCYLIDIKEWFKESQDFKEEPIDERLTDISQLTKGVPAKLVLLYELDLYKTLLNRVKENRNVKKDLARIIGHVIGETNVDYIYSFLNIEILDPFAKQYNNPLKDSPFTEEAILEMKRIMLQCNLRIVKDYPEGKNPKISSSKKK